MSSMAALSRSRSRSAALRFLGDGVREAERRQAAPRGAERAFSARGWLPELQWVTRPEVGSLGPASGENGTAPQGIYSGKHAS